MLTLVDDLPVVEPDSFDIELWRVLLTEEERKGRDEEEKKRKEEEDKQKETEANEKKSKYDSASDLGKVQLDWYDKCDEVIKETEARLRLKRLNAKQRKELY